MLALLWVLQGVSDAAVVAVDDAAGREVPALWPLLAGLPAAAPFQVQLQRAATPPRASPPRAVAAPSQRERRAELMQGIEGPMESPREPDGPPESDPAAPLALAAVRAGDERKAKRISALRVTHLTSATNFFVTLVGTSKPQINAIVKNIEDELFEAFGRRAHRQGKALGGWVCLDYDSVVVNVFSEAQADYYNLEKFWAGGQELDLSGVVQPSEPEAVEAKTEQDDWTLNDDWTLDDDWKIE